MTPSRPWASDDVALAAIASPSVSRASALGVRTGPAAPESPAYGDWTRPSRPGETDSGPIGLAGDDDYLSGPIGPRVHAPVTSLIPDRTVAPRRERAEQQYTPDQYGDEYEAGYDAGYEAGPIEADGPAPSRGPATGPVVGGRATKRAERQAIELVRQQAAKRNGVSSVAVLDEDETPGGKRRVARGLFAMVVLALVVLGAYSFVSPHTKVAAAQNNSTAAVDAASAAAAAASDTAALPPLTNSAPVAAPPAVTVPVRLPITVLNATTVNGLAAKAAKAFTAKGWQAPSVGAYKGGDIASSTVYFAQGDEKQRQAAVQLADQFPQLTGPAPRFFQLPAGVSAPGLVVVLTGDWRP
jgi:Tfp pilus assembly protein PilX